MHGFCTFVNFEMSQLSSLEGIPFTISDRSYDIFKLFLRQLATGASVSI
jgi:hypothetical protein